MKYNIRLDINQLENKKAELMGVANWKKGECSVVFSIPYNADIKRVLSRESIVSLFNELACKDMFDDCFDQLLDDINAGLDLTDMDLYYISYDMSDIAISDYLNNNDFFYGKNIVISGLFDINSKDLERARVISGDLDKYYFNIQGSNDIINFSKYEEIVNTIEQTVSEIKENNLSPLEQVMYAYDIVRDRVYKEEDVSESPLLSRDISYVLFGDNIVCSGYEVILRKILYNLGVDCINYHLVRKDRNIAHDRNVVHIIDNKYNIDGLFFLDPTWDSKKINGNNDYLSSYKYFLMDLSTMKKYDKNVYLDQTFFDFNDDVVNEFKENVNDVLVDAYKLDRKSIAAINSMSKFIDGISLINVRSVQLKKMGLDDKYIKSLSMDYILARLNYYKSLINTKIDYSVYLEVLFNVRKIQYKKDSDKYKFDIQEFRKIAMYSNWVNFEYYTNDLLSIIFGINESYMISPQFDEYARLSNMSSRIEDNKAQKVLKKDMI